MSHATLFKWVNEFGCWSLILSVGLDNMQSLWTNSNLQLRVRLDITKTQCVYTFFFSLRSVFQYFPVSPVHCLRDLQTSFFNKTFIKNESYGTVYTFKNYFATVFPVFSKISDIQKNASSKKKKKKKIQSTTHYIQASYVDSSYLN